MACLSRCNWTDYDRELGEDTVSESLEEVYGATIPHTANRQYVGHEETSGSGDQEQTLLEQLKETHANALPGVLRPEEGEDSRSTAAVRNRPYITLPSLRPRQRRIACSALTPVSKLSESEKDTLHI